MRVRQAIFSTALLGLVHAASISIDVANLPSCGLPCWQSAINTSGCGLTDYPCQCSTSNSNLIVPLTGNCLLKSCSPADAVTFAELSDDICSQVSLGSTAVSTPYSTAASTAGSGSTTAKATSGGQSSATAPLRSGSTANAASETTNPASSSTSSTIIQTTATSATSSNGLSTGAIAGIAVGGVVVIVAIILGIFLCRRRRKKRNANAVSNPPNPEYIVYGPDKVGVPELISPANAHELHEKVAAKYELQTPASELHSSPLTTPRSELPTEATAFFARKPVPSRESPDIKLTVATPTSPAHSARSVPLATAMAAPEETGEGSQDEAKLSILRDRIDRIRDEKARLERLQELEDLEEQTKKEIMMEQRKGAGF